MNQKVVSDKWVNFWVLLNIILYIRCPRVTEGIFYTIFFAFILYNEYEPSLLSLDTQYKVQSLVLKKDYNIFVDLSI